MAKYEVELYGWGGEFVIGTLSNEQYDFWIEHEGDGLDSHVFWDPYDEGDGDNPVTDDEDPRFLGYWHDLDDIGHVCGASVDSCRLVVTSMDSGEEIYTSDEVNVKSTEDQLVDDQKRGFYWTAYASEKGQHFYAELEIDGDFDPNKLTMYATNINGEHIIDEVMYDGETLDNDGGSTDTKSQGYDLHEIV